LEPKFDREAIFRKLLDGSCSPEEVDWLMAILSAEELDPLLANFMQEQLAAGVQADAVPPAVQERLHHRLQHILDSEDEVVQPRRIVFRSVFWRAVAALLILLAGTGGYFALIRKSSSATTHPTVQTVQNDIAPGGNRAILTLSGGQKILLDSTANGALTRQGGSLVEKQNGQLSYTAGDEKYTTGDQKVETGKAPMYNTLSIPRGGQYRLILPDGTKVWLDAESSITYPTAFAGKIREVTVMGQAYLEVVHNPKIPFRVIVNGVGITDIGTQFNIYAYKDDPMTRITLVDGAVSVRKGNINMLLHPGEQAASLNSENLQKIKVMDMDAVIAWKNGIFHFNHTTLPLVLQQLSRWYNMEVEYDGTPPVMKFSGELGRNLSLAQLLTLLGKTGLRFRIENQKLTIIGEK
jgi:ferric-dicitrate binding protein FerR (iron transport regulator)